MGQHPSRDQKRRNKLKKAARRKARKAAAAATKGGGPPPLPVCRMGSTGPELKIVSIDGDVVTAYVKGGPPKPIKFSAQMLEIVGGISLSQAMRDARFMA